MTVNVVVLEALAMNLIQEENSSIGGFMLPLTAFRLRQAPTIAKENRDIPQAQIPSLTECNAWL